MEGSGEAGRENVLVGGLSSPWDFLSDLPPLHLSWNRRSRERLQEREGWGQCRAAGVWLLHP